MKRPELNELTLSKIERLGTPDSLRKFHVFVDLISRWRNITNLMSEEGFQNVWERHILDSVYLQHLFPSYRNWLDLGTGAGFPGIVLGILLADDKYTQIHCVESDSRKCAFLRSVVQELHLPVKVHNIRANELSNIGIVNVEVVTARAFSSIESILQLSEDYMLSGAVLILPLGRTSMQAVEAVDLNRYKLTVDANPLAQGGMFVHIRLQVRRV